MEIGRALASTLHARRRFPVHAYDAQVDRLWMQQRRGRDAIEPRLHRRNQLHQEGQCRPRRREFPKNVRVGERFREERLHQRGSRLGQHGLQSGLFRGVRGKTAEQAVETAGGTTEDVEDLGEERLDGGGAGEKGPPDLVRFLDFDEVGRREIEIMEELENVLFVVLRVDSERVSTVVLHFGALEVDGEMADVSVIPIRSQSLHFEEREQMTTKRFERFELVLRGF